MHHVPAGRDGNEYMLYIDGKLEAETDTQAMHISHGSHTKEKHL